MKGEGRQKGREKKERERQGRKEGTWKREEEEGKERKEGVGRKEETRKREEKDGKRRRKEGRGANLGCHCNSRSVTVSDAEKASIVYRQKIF